ncbi:MAG: hypothetical protein J2P18_13260, partial [Nocardia sp.]|nr:hypothetical protein [Nocardia sp.]
MPIVFDSGGLQQLDRMTWGNPATRDVITLSYIDMAPDLPAPLTELDTLRRHITAIQAEFGCLVEAYTATVDRLPALLRVEKFPLSDSGSALGFTAGLVIPKARCSAILKIMCPETGRAGKREAGVVRKVGFANMFPPHPYAPEIRGKLPYNAADDPCWDDEFPDHPLSRARRWINHVRRTVRVDPRFAELPAFTGPEGAAGAEPEAADPPETKPIPA